ncbi:low temperature requirement protein A [Kribbella sancticallisti]|uniref:Low temperature requirement protein A n=2 Tax=Kribbella sancticallisti TaxID=460087 RepID=A0ABN2DQ01_9ACTN
MTARPIDEPHRAASSLELLFDLIFVVAIAAATAEFAHSIADAHALDGLLPFLQVFFAIWWAWMNFTWFASAFDTDDVAYRLLTMLQMAGALVLAAGVPVASEHGDYRGVTLGYLVMRIGLVAQWLRASIEDPERRRTARRYAAGISVLTAGWLVRLVLGQAGLLPHTIDVVVFVALAVLEIAVPSWAERPRPTNWHPHHIAERYGLFTIILLGESVLAATIGLQSALDAAKISVNLIVIAAASLVVLFALWWLYFLEPAGVGLRNRRERSYLWGYLHYGLFAALAAVGAGLEVAVEQTGHKVKASSLQTCYAVAIPTAVFLVLLWVINRVLFSEPVVRPSAVLVSAALILLLPLAAPGLGVAAVIAAIATVCVLLVSVLVAWNHKAALVREHDGLDAVAEA